MVKFYEMPAISPTMELGTIVAWRIAEGAAFEPQAVVAEVGTDKANMEAEVFDKGVMLKHLVAEGDEVPPGYPIAIVGDAAGEDISALLAEFEAKKAAAPAKPAAKVDATETPGAEAAERELARDLALAAGSAPIPAPAQASAPAQPPVAGVAKGLFAREWMGKPLGPNNAEPRGDIRYGSAAVTTARVIASPLAKAVAADKGVDLSRVKGSGPGGRVVQADVEAASSAPPAGAKRAPPRADEAIRLTPMRKTIAKRLLASHTEIPTFFLTVSYDMGAFVAFREALKKGMPEVKISYNDVLVACVARALRESPKVNAAWGDAAITRFGRVDIGIAVAVPDGLITPVVRGADGLSFAEIASTVRDLAARAKAQKLDPAEYTGSTFTISNLGMYDIDQFTAIINPPEAAILAVGSIAQVPVAVSGALTVGWRMRCTMTCDHRVVDGATGAEFLQVLRRYVEAPMLLLV